MYIRRLPIIFGTILILACAGLSMAQTSTGSIRGAVTDPTGAFLPGATITVKNLDTNSERKLASNDEGLYNADNLLPGQTARFGLLGDLSVRNIQLLKSTGVGQGIFSNDTRTPYSIHTNFGVQREVIRNLAVTADFVMRRGVAFGGPHGLFGVDHQIE